MTDAYAAGLVDGEGCLTITKDQRKGWFYVRIDLGMSLRSLGLLNGLKAEYGGTVRMFREATERWEEAHVWRAFGKVAANMLIRISPYLQLKTEQARLCLCLQEMVDALPRNPNGSAQWTSEVRQKAEALRLLVSELNRKGSRSQPKPGWFARVVGDYLVTPQQDLFSDLGYTIYCETFPESGFMQDGFVYELATSGPAISGKGCSSSRTWNTPLTEDHKTDGPAAIGRYERGEAMTCDMRLRTQTMTWPTARSEDSESCGNHPGAMDSLTGATATWRTPDTPGSGGPRNRQDSIGDGHQVTIAEQAEHWPTPKQAEDRAEKYTTTTRKHYQEGRQISLGQFASDCWQTPATDSFRSRGGDRKDEPGLDQQARMFENWPSPRMSDRSGESSVRVNDPTKRFQLREAVMMPHSASLPAPPIPDGPQSSENAPTLRRRLNPRFVEWLQGFPVTWTEL